MGWVTGGVKPSLLRAIPKGTVVFNLLFGCSIFDSLWGSPRGAILESFWRHSGVHFGDILESILERKIDLSGTERIVSNAGVLLYCSFGAAGVLHWGHSNASFPRNATHRLAGHAAARRKPSARPPSRGCVEPRQTLSPRSPQRNGHPANALLAQVSPA